MDYCSRERLIEKISWGCCLVEDFVLCMPTSEDKAMGSLVYENSYNIAVSTEMMTENELLQYLFDSDQWSIDDENKIELIKKDIYKMVKGMLSLFFHKSKLESLRKMIRNAEFVLTDLLTRKQNLLNNTAENYALLNKQKYIISRITKDKNGQLLWPTQEHFDKYSDTALINKLISAFFSESRISSKKIRLLARTSPWRQIWNIAKTNGKLFNKQITEWTENQIDLASWSSTYDLVYEAYERPQNVIIEDDDLLDSWLIGQSEKIEERSKKEMNVDKKSNKGGREEVFVFSDQQGSGDIYALNDPISRATIKAKQKIISQKGVVKDQHMPDSQQELRMRATQMIREKHKRK